MTPQHGRRRRSSPRLALCCALAALVLSSCVDEIGAIAPQDRGQVAAGRVLYADTCASCHGTELRGTSSGPSLLSEIYEPNHHADGAFLSAVLRGSLAHHWRFGDMPPVAGLTQDDVAAIVAFVREQQRVQGFEPYPPP